MKHPRVHRQGTLLEALVATCIFAIAFVLMLAAFPTAARAVRQSEEVMAGTFLAERRLEAVRALDYLYVVDDSETVGLTARTNGVAQTTEYIIQTLVTEPQPGQLKRVRVLVSWQRTLSRHLEVVTYVAKLN